MNHGWRSIGKARHPGGERQVGDGVLTSKVALTIEILGVEFQFLESR
jgi:hypothetical protein